MSQTDGGGLIADAATASPGETSAGPREGCAHGSASHYREELTIDATGYRKDYSKPPPGFPVPEGHEMTEAEIAAAWQEREAADAERERAKAAERERVAAAERGANARQAEERERQWEQRVRKERERIRRAGEITAVNEDGRESFTFEQWANDWRSASEERRDELAESVRFATLINSRGEEVTGRELERLRRRLANPDTFRGPKTNTGPLDRDAASPRRSLIEGLWPWNTVPMLGGTAKAGKTLVVIDLAAALVCEGYRFLGRFPPVELTDDERGYDDRTSVVVINAETPPEDFDAALRARLADGWGVSGPGAIEAWDSLEVEHLELLGGAHVFDLTDPDKYEYWFERLTYCQKCDGTDDRLGPVVLLVDGVTRILTDAGKGPEQYAEFYSAFKRLTREVQTPNALGTWHTGLNNDHPLGGSESMAGPDGLWTYRKSQAGKRQFSVLPRLGGTEIPPTVVDMDASGRLRLAESGSRPVSRISGPIPAPQGNPPDPTAIGPLNFAQTSLPAVPDAVIEYVRSCNALGHGPSKNQVRRNVRGNSVEKDAAVDALVSSGQIELRHRAGRGGGYALWVAGPGPGPGPGPEPGPTEPR